MQDAEAQSTGHWQEKLQRCVLAAWTCCLVLAIFPVDGPATHVKHLISGVFAVVISLLWLASAGRLRPKAPFTPGMQILTGLLLAHLVAALASPHRLAALYALYPWLCFSVFAFAAGRLYAEQRHAERLFAVIAAAIAVSSVYGFVQHFGFDPFPWAEAGKLEYTALPATYGNPNYAGHALVFGIVLALGLAARPGKRWWLLPAMLMMGHLYLTGMRSAVLALMAAALLLLLFAGINRVLKRPLTSAFIVFMIFTGLGGAAAHKAWQAIPAEGPVPIDSSIILRLNSYRAASEMVLEAPYLGAVAAEGGDDEDDAE